MWLATEKGGIISASIRQKENYVILDGILTNRILDDNSKVNAYNITDFSADWTIASLM